MNFEKNTSKEELEMRIEEEMDFEKLSQLCEHIKDAIKEVLSSCGLYFRIFSRVKSPESLATKLLRGKYGSKENPKKIQDLLGVRVVLYYYDDLSICRDIMESTFQLIDKWSKNNYNADEFKATKINGVFRYPAEYFSLYNKELWSLPIDTTFEIQFRTVFFEGWHEIEHDMRYKSFLTDDQFWEGSEELSRMLNCILANLELSDWSLVQLFEQLSYNHYKHGNWELMLKSHYRIKMDDSDKLHPDIIKIFDSDKTIAKEFFKCSRLNLIKELLTLDHPLVNYNTIVKLVNERIVHSQEITETFEHIEIPMEEHTFHKVTMARLEQNALFHLEIPLLHKETRTLQSEFTNASSILFKWARFKLNPVFEDIPSELGEYHNNIPGYHLDINYNAEQMTYDMEIHYIDMRQVGTIWHIHANIAQKDDGLLYFSHKTTLDMPHGASQRPTFNKPSFLSDLSNKVGLMDLNRLSNKEQFITNAEEYEIFKQFIYNPERRLPVIMITQKTDSANTEDKDNNFRDGYDMNSFHVNGTRLAKVIGLYSHVYMLDKSLSAQFARDNDISEENSYGCICIFWPAASEKSPELFTWQMICDTQFDFNKVAFHDQNISEKAFRHKLVQIIKDDNVSH